MGWRRFVGVVAIAALVPGPLDVVAGVGHAVAAPAEVLERPNSGSASVAARASGKRVEVAGLRAETGQVFANPTGSFTAEVTARPVRVRRPHGQWVPVDLTLRPNQDGTVSAAASPASIRLSGGGSGALVTIARASAELSLGWPGALPRPMLSGDTATYPEVLPGVDLTVRVDVDGFSEVLVVKDRQAAANPALAKVRFSTATRNLTVKPGPDGSVIAVDSSGEAVFASGTPMMWESTGGSAGVAGPGDGARRAAMPVQVAADGLTITPDRAMLTSESTRFPVFIDPVSRAVGRSNWSMINQRHAGQSYWSFDRADGAKVGYVEELYNGDGWERYRSMFEFPTDQFRGTHVLSAKFSADILYSYYHCDDSPTDLYLTNGINAGTTWNNHASSWTNYLASAPSSACSGRKYVEWTSNALRDWTDWAGKAWPTITLGLRANDEGWINRQWKKFDPNTATLSVTFNWPPNAPSAMTVDGRGCATGANRPFVASKEPTLSAFLSDPDAADQLNTSFYWAALGQPLSDANRLPMGSIANNSTVPMRIPPGRLTDQTTYYWQAQAADYIDLSPWSAACEFTVDATRPAAAPTVASTDYPADGSYHGGVGRTGTFTFDANGVGDVASYVYGLSDPPTQEVAASGLGGTATVTLTPQSRGVNTLYVRSKDRAGNLSPEPEPAQRYTFHVGSATPPVASWSMDEGAGSTLFDSSGNDHSATLSSGGSWTAGRLGNGAAVALNGTSTGLASTAGPIVRTDRSFSVAAWAKLNQADTGFHAVVAQDGTQVSGFFLDYRGDTGKWVFWFPAGDCTTCGYAAAFAGTVVRPGSWTHLAGVYDAGSQQLRIYVNGVLAGQGTGTSWRADGPLRIGGNMWNGVSPGTFPGAIDDVRVWDRVVYGDELAALATKPTLVSHWSFDEGSGSQVEDLSGFGNTASLVGVASWTTGHDGSGGAVYFGGTGGAVTTLRTPGLLTDQSYTAATWVRLDSAGTSRPVLQQWGSITSTFDLSYSVSGGSARWAFGSSVRSTAAPAVGAWTHLAGVYDATTGQKRLYVNGQLAGVVSAGGQSDGSSSLEIGRNRGFRGAYYYWHGAVDEVRLYQGVLSDQQITQLAQA